LPKVLQEIEMCGRSSGSSSDPAFPSAGWRTVAKGLGYAFDGFTVAGTASDFPGYTNLRPRTRNSLFSPNYSENRHTISMSELNVGHFKVKRKEILFGPRAWDLDHYIRPLQNFYHKYYSGLRR